MTEIRVAKRKEQFLAQYTLTMDHRGPTTSEKKYNHDSYTKYTNVPIDAIHECSPLKQTNKQKTT